jgi:Na+(H+)/acetate symporter ActP
LAEGYAKQTAIDAWVNEARAFAIWGGVDRHFAAVFAVPLGFVVTIAVSLLTLMPRPDVQNFVRELRKR